MTDRYVFTVTAGRSGQHSLTSLLTKYVPRCYAAFEEPHVHGVLPFPFRTLERMFRRRFVETNELLGRGRVLTAFEHDDRAYLASVAQRRLTRARHSMTDTRSTIYFDVSKFYARGLHAGFAELLPSFSLLHLVRDPVRNMRSFLNRGKRFALDNGSPDSKRNELRLDSASFPPGHFYLWAWCEMGLRFDRLANTSNVVHHAELRTEDMTVPDRMAAALAALHIDHLPLGSLEASNTNESQGFGPTRVRREDIELFESFQARIPAAIRQRIRYLNDYDPWIANRAYLSDDFTMILPFALKKLIPGYSARWRSKYQALIRHVNELSSDVDLGWDDRTPWLRSRSNGVVLRGFVTEPENIQVYEMLRPQLPASIPESHFRLIKDYITRYIYPHMRPDLKPTGFGIEQLWGFHGQHKDAIADTDAAHQTLLTTAFRGRPDDVIIDGGAFLGFGEVRIAPALTDGRIVAVEASAACFQLLSRNIAENKLSNVVPLHRAVWNTETEIDLESSYAQANSLVSEVHQGERRQPVRTASIDALVGECGLTRVDMISLTLNGAEVEALAGARETLGRWHPRIRLAGWYHRDGKPIWKITSQILEGHGYRIFAGRRGNLMALHPSRA